MSDQISEPLEQTTSSSVLPGSAAPLTEIHFRLSGNLDATASMIRGNEFSRAGTGPAGILFRLMERTSGDDLDNAWGELISLSEKLWDAGHNEESHKLLRMAELTLHVPDLFRERVRQSIASAEQEVIKLRAERMFEAGDAEGAQKIAASIEDDSIRAQYVADLGRRDTTRRKTRKAGTAVAGGCAVVLLLMAMNGISSMREVFANPPSLDLPSFPTEAYRENFGPVIAATRAKVAAELPSPASQLAPSPAPGTVGSPGSGPDTPMPTTPPAVAQAPLAPEAAKQAEACALGRAAVVKAAADAGITPADTAPQSLITFVGKVNALCETVDLPAAELDRMAAGIPSETVSAVASGIIARAD